MPVDFADRIEFASDAWVDAARESLERAVAEAGSALDGIRFSLCESYTDAPPHLARPGNLAAWHARFDGASVSVGAGIIDDADFRIHGPYSAVLPLSRTVYGSDTRASVRAQRENVHRAGRDAIEFIGQPPAPVLMPVLARLHDDLAPRTVDNPDLAHRLDRQGLTGNSKELLEQGYTVLERAVSDGFVDELRATILERIDEHAPRPAAMLLERGRIFEEAALQPQLMSLAEVLCGKGFLLAQLLGQRKPAGVPLIPMHSDYNLMREPFPEHPQQCTACWALEDWALEVGPTRVVPGSQRKRRHPGPEEGGDESIAIEMPKGSIAIWDGATWHAQSERTAPGERVTLHSTYSRMTLRTYDSYRDIDPAILDRNPPELATLAGFDDVFEKNTYAGPDFRRLRHASKLFRT
ncbi:MAG: hypothetical protein GY725_19050 [bacterium]|nr:hypothetical protein [bacterium]